MSDGDKRDFREFYGVDDALTAGISSLRFHFTARGAASSVMTKQTTNRGYHVHRIRSRYDITFGRPENFHFIYSPASGGIAAREDDVDLAGRLGRYDEFIIPPASEDVLLLSAGDDTSFETGKPILALRYGIYDDEFVIAYAQTPSEVTLDDYLTVKDDLGVRPHEFLFAQFIARAAPILNKYPATGVYVAPHYQNKPVYPTLRDRFFDRHYSLNPWRQRVQEILGADNAWLKESSMVLRMEREDAIRTARDVGAYLKHHVLWRELLV